MFFGFVHIYTKCTNYKRYLCKLNVIKIKGYFSKNTVKKKKMQGMD